MSSFNLGDILANVIGYKGFPYLGGFFPDKPAKYQGSGYDYPGEPASEKLIRIWVASCARKTHKAAGTLCRLCLNNKGTE